MSLHNQLPVVLVRASLITDAKCLFIRFVPSLCFLDEMKIDEYFVSFVRSVYLDVVYSLRRPGARSLTLSVAVLGALRLGVSVDHGVHC